MRAVRIGSCYSLVLMLCALTNSNQVEAATKRAFVIGISNYKNLGPLAKPTIDADIISKKLQSANYLVQPVLDEDATKVNLLKKWEAFLKSVQPNDDVVVFYAGHGLDVLGRNMLLPYDSPKSEDVGGVAGFKNHFIAFRSLMSDLEDLQVRIQVWIIDACRENPYSEDGRNFLAKGGLKADYRNNTLDSAQGNAFVFLSAGYGQIALDRLRNEKADDKVGSPYTRTFVELFDVWKARPVAGFAQAVRDAVIDKVKPNPQRPAYSDETVGQWCFAECEEGTKSVQIATETQSVDVPITNNELKDAVKALAASIRAPVVNNNAVYLGKKSAAADCVEKVSDQFPFGCSLLKLLSTNTGGATDKPLLPAGAVMATTNVNMRKRLPTNIGSQLVYECKVGMVKIGERVKIASAVAYEFSGDTYYWGVVDETPKDCVLGG